MSSIDHRDAQVQTNFTAMKKAPDEAQKFRIAEQIAKMYEKSDDYTYGVIDSDNLDILPNVQVRFIIQ